MPETYFTKERENMETTLQPSLQNNLRARITTIEAIELAFLGLGISFVIALLTLGSPEIGLINILVIFLALEVGLLGSWAIYNLYIRIARAGGSTVDVMIWVIASLATGSYTFWAWTILDINRLLVAKLLYRGTAPVEYAWSARSKQARKAWEQTQKASNI
jgi:hypothetical protein